MIAGGGSMLESATSEPPARPLRFLWRMAAGVVKGANMFGKYLSNASARWIMGTVPESRNLFKYPFKYGAGLVRF